MSPTTELRNWIAVQARPLRLDPAYSAITLPESLSQAKIVGLASSVRSSRQLVLATHVLLRRLVEQAGFRAVAIEGTSETAVALDRFVRTGEGDPATLLAASQSFLRTREALGVIRWLRTWNEAHPNDPVSIVHDRVPGTPPSGLAEIEEHLADSDLAWHADTGQRIVHWGGTAHVIAGNPRTVPPEETHRNAGGIMRVELGEGYGVAAFTVGSGSAPIAVPAPPQEFTEHAFAEAPHDIALLELASSNGVPQPVADWLRRPLRTRMIGPRYDATRDQDFRVDAGPLQECVDVLIHAPRITATSLLTHA
ncbi:erythromycin esterase family protein [Actinopolyspora saharensis]|uniref:Erythromycin esterase n=1 Tax=Actinopolyspora saharensis TaxID=995062 RepID=A0A1H0ZPY0_9ACTN|nr:erythromycin esterase family protein [Actinopolyspora saharensis]SDQ29528.1 erythromycin esterase [Actinopolyspora saharensis]